MCREMHANRTHLRVASLIGLVEHASIFLPFSWANGTFSHILQIPRLILPRNDGKQKVRWKCWRSVQAAQTGNGSRMNIYHRIWDKCNFLRQTLWALSALIPATSQEKLWIHSWMEFLTTEMKGRKESYRLGTIKSCWDLLRHLGLSSEENKKMASLMKDWSVALFFCPSSDLALSFQMIQTRMESKAVAVQMFQALARTGAHSQPFPAPLQPRWTPTQVTHLTAWKSPDFELASKLMVKQEVTWWHPHRRCPRIRRKTPPFHPHSNPNINDKTQRSNPVEWNDCFS